MTSFVVFERFSPIIDLPRLHLVPGSVVGSQRYLWLNEERMKKGRRINGHHLSYPSYLVEKTVPFFVDSLHLLFRDSIPSHSPPAKRHLMHIYPLATREFSMGATYVIGLDVRMSAERKLHNLKTPKQALAMLNSPMPTGFPSKVA